MVRPSPAPVPSHGLLARLAGVIVSPRATYEAIAARPRILGALLTVLLVSGLATFTFLSTEVGQNALFDEQLAQMENFGFKPSEAQITMMEQRAEYSRYFALAGQLVVIPVGMLVVAAIGLAIFNAGLGGNATFKQVYAVIAHSWFLPMLQVVFVLPLNYATGSMAGSTSLAVFLPMLDKASFAARLLGQIDLFRIWWAVSLAIGFAALYKRKTSPIAWGFLAVYGVIALTMAGIMTARSGA
jgi:uncharacterized membrane protein (DUF2068 family)